MTKSEQLAAIAKVIKDTEERKLLVSDDREIELEAAAYAAIQTIMEQPVPRLNTMKDVRELIDKTRATWPLYQFHGGFGAYDDDDEKRWYEARKDERFLLLNRVEEMAREDRADS